MKFLASTIGNSIVYSIMVVIMSSHLSPYLAGKFTTFKFGKLQSLKRSKTEVGLILLIQTCIDLSPAFAIGLVDESCLRYYIKFVGGLETLVQSDRFPSCFSYSNGLATNIYHLLVYHCVWQFVDWNNEQTGMGAYRKNVCSRALMRKFLYVSGCAVNSCAVSIVIQVSVCTVA